MVGVKISDIMSCVSSCEGLLKPRELCISECMSGEADAYRVSRNEYIVMDRYRSRVISLKVKEYIVADLDRLAARLQVSRSDLIREAIFDLLKKYGVIWNGHSPTEI